MDIDGFWALVEAADRPAQLHAALADLPADELADFERLHAQVYARTYDWGLWGAAFVLAGGCSDDGFDYFRAYLISLGRKVYEAALADPDSLADVETLDDGEEWEDWMSPTMFVVKARTGKYGYVTDDRVPRAAKPTGEDWDEETVGERYPRMAAKYGWSE